MVEMTMIEDFKDAIDDWHANVVGADPEMDAVYKSDRADLRVSLDLLAEGSEVEAWDALRHLDTIVRDLVPSSIWDYLQNKYDYPVEVKL